MIINASYSFSLMPAVPPKKILVLDKRPERTAFLEISIQSLNDSSNSPIFMSSSIPLSYKKATHIFWITLKGCLNNQ